MKPQMKHTTTHTNLNEEPNEIQMKPKLFESFVSNPSERKMNRGQNFSFMTGRENSPSKVHVNRKAPGIKPN